MTEIPLKTDAKLTSWLHPYSAKLVATDKLSAGIQVPDTLNIDPLDTAVHLGLPRYRSELVECMIIWDRKLRMQVLLIEGAYRLMVEHFINWLLFNLVCPPSACRHRDPKSAQTLAQIRRVRYHPIPLYHWITIPLYHWSLGNEWQPYIKTQTTDFFPSAIAVPDPQGQRVQKLGRHRWRRYHSKLMPN